MVREAICPPGTRGLADAFEDLERFGTGGYGGSKWRMNIDDVMANQLDDGGEKCVVCLPDRWWLFAYWRKEVSEKAEREQAAKIVAFPAKAAA